MLIGADSWYSPNTRILNILKQLDGFTFYGGYLNHWSSQDWAILRYKQVTPLPIWLPDWSREPIAQANRAMRRSRMSGMRGAIALDTTLGLGKLGKPVDWIDEWCNRLLKEDFYPIEHSNYRHSSLTFLWLAKWGEHEELPNAGEAIQHGPYVLTDNTGKRIATLVSDVADENFPLAYWIERPRPIQ
jgi:hypothetical protein